MKVTLEELPCNDSMVCQLPVSKKTLVSDGAPSIPCARLSLAAVEVGQAQGKGSEATATQVTSLAAGQRPCFKR